MNRLQNQKLRAEVIMFLVINAPDRLLFVLNRSSKFTAPFSISFGSIVQDKIRLRFRTI